MTTIVPARQIWSLRIVSFPRYRGNEPGYDVCMRGKICATTSLLPITSTIAFGLQLLGGGLSITFDVPSERQHIQSELLEFNLSKGQNSIEFSAQRQGEHRIT